MSLQNKLLTRAGRAATNRTDRTNDNEQQDVYFIDDIDDIEDINDNDVEPKVNLTNKKRKRAAKEPTSFVWNYFKKGENLTSAICQVIKEDGTECGHYYNDRSTTSNLIHHLATKHKIHK